MEELDISKKIEKVVDKIVQVDSLVYKPEQVENRKKQGIFLSKKY